MYRHKGRRSVKTLVLEDKEERNQKKKKKKKYVEKTKPKEKNAV